MPANNNSNSLGKPRRGQKQNFGAESTPQMGDRAMRVGWSQEHAPSQPWVRARKHIFYERVQTWWGWREGGLGMWGRVE
jgi:hypothetical protein